MPDIVAVLWGAIKDALGATRRRRFPRIVFLLGAGASKDAGFPLMAEMVEGFIPWLAGKSRPDEVPLRSLFERIVEMVRHPHVGHNIERVLEFLDDLTLFKSGQRAEAISTWNPPFDSQLPVVARLSELLQEYLLERLSQPPSASTDYLRGLLDLETDPPVDVFTLNYDCLLESVADKFGVTFTTGFNGAWDPSVFDQPGWRLRIYKLHGSVDWYRPGGGHVIYRGARDHPASQEVMIYPTRAKPIHAEPFSTLMSLFRAALATADFCIAIGYSFADAHVRRAVVDRMVANPGLQLLVVDPKARHVVGRPAEEIGEPAFGDFGPRISWLHAGAKDALEGGKIRSRLDEIEGADAILADIVALRTQGDTVRAAVRFLELIEFCRGVKLPDKPFGVYQELRHAEFRTALASLIGERIDRDLASRPFETDPTPNVAERVANQIGLWALAIALAPVHAPAIQAEIVNVIRWYASNIVILSNGKYWIWASPVTLNGPTLALKRAQDLSSLWWTLSQSGPETAVAMIRAVPGPTRRHYGELLEGIQILRGYYSTLHTNGTVARQFKGITVIVPSAPGWQELVATMSSAFLKTRLRETWLPDPSDTGPVSDLDSL